MATITGDSNHNNLTGTTGDDTIDGLNRNDTINARAGNDLINGGSGSDSINAGDGNDTITNTSENGSVDNQTDVINGNGGDDHIYGSFGNDSINGGTGTDTYDTSNLTGQPVRADLENGNLAFTNTTGSLAQKLTNIENLTTGAGKDTITGSSGNNIINSGGQADSVNGLAGDDTILSGNGRDTVDGGDGADSINGGAGADVINGDGGNDTLLGGGGNDALSGGSGSDNMTGGDGIDQYTVTSSNNGHDVITDFGVGNTGSIDDEDQTNNEFVDLSSFYNETNLAAYNAANPSNQFKNPLQWMRADQEDGTLDDVNAGWDGNNSLTIQNGGSAVDGSELTYDTTNVVCFTRGALIKTAKGEVPVETLSVGDLVLTRDRGYQPIRWIGSNEISAKRLEKTKKLRPIRVKAGALGENSPSQDLLLSPHHRVLVSSDIVKRMFKRFKEVLVPVKDLLVLDGVEIAWDQKEVEYFHFLFDRHEIVWSNSVPTESLYTGAQALNSLGVAARAEIYEIFPEVALHDYNARACRKMTKGRMGRELAIRHKVNYKSLVNALNSPAVPSKHGQIGSHQA